MNQTLPSFSAVLKAIDALCNGRGVIVTDSFERENEADLIFSAQTLTVEQTALLIRECSGIICLCLPSEKVDSLGLKMMTSNNHSKFQTAFTVSIEAKHGITTGVSAHDRQATIQAAIADNGIERIVSPGHIFPLRGRPNGILEREGHTEATIDLMRLAKFMPYGVLCELTNPDGTMMRGKKVQEFSKQHNFPMLSIDELVSYRKYLLTMPVK